MTKKDSHRKTLQEILESRSYDKLGPYLKEGVLQDLCDDSKRLLRDLLQAQGESLVDERNPAAIDVFKKAAEISPQDYVLFLTQGAVLAEAKDFPDFIPYAIDCFSKAAELKSDCFEVWFCWGRLVHHQAEEFEDEELGEAAQQLFMKASECTVDDARLHADFFWAWGMVDGFLGRLHGEAVDFKKALVKFSTAAALGQNASNFWEHYGHTICELGSLVNNPESMFEGREHFQRSVEVDPENGSGWLSLAFCNQKLYEVFGKAEDFESGCSAFERALPFSLEDSQFWFRWAMLFFINGRMTIDSTKLSASFDKFKKAVELDAGDALILSKWGESEMVFGIYNERIDYLRQAEAHIISSLKLKDDNVEAWYVYGTCLNEMGRYFAEASYYFQAIEKFQYGLYLTPNDPMLLQGVALSYYSIGEMKGDHSLIELSIVYCEKAVESSKAVPPQLYNDWGISLMKMAEMTGDKSFLEAAVEKFEVALASYNEDVPDAFDPEWLYNYGCALDFLGDFYDDANYYERSIQMLTKFLSIDPSYVHAHYNLASAYSHLGELVGDVDCFHKAIEHFQRFLNEDNEDEMVWNDYGLTLLNLADLLSDPSLPNLSQVCFAQAEEKFLHAVSLGNSSTFYNLACLYSLMGHLPQALHYMEKGEQQRALPPVEEILDDEWLENLRRTPEFKAFLANLTSEPQD